MWQTTSFCFRVRPPDSHMVLKERVPNSRPPVHEQEKFQNRNTKGRSSEECSCFCFPSYSVSGEYPSYLDWLLANSTANPPLVSLDTYIDSVTLCLQHCLEGELWIKMTAGGYYRGILGRATAETSPCCSSMHSRGVSSVLKCTTYNYYLLKCNIKYYYAEKRFILVLKLWSSLLPYSCPHTALGTTTVSVCTSNWTS